MRTVSEAFEAKQHVCSVKIMRDLLNHARYQGTNAVETAFAEGMKEKSWEFSATGGEIYREV